jgi:uncharacterized OB-fold protein
VLPLFDPPCEVSVAAPFWEGIAAGELRLPRCSRCQRWQWYPDDAGPDCEGATYEWVSVGGGGTVHTMVRVNRSFLPGVRAAPYVVGLVELDDAPGIRLVSFLADDADIGIGDRVVAEFRDIDGRRRPLFVPAPAA